MKQRRALVAIPCYNEERKIQQVVEGIGCVINGWSIAADIFVFDDASTDHTLELLEKYQDISILTSEKNLGYASNLSRIFAFAYDREYDLLFVIDGDGQHDPLNLQVLLSKISEGYGSVVASRYENATAYKLTLPKKIGIFFYRIMLLFLGCGWISDPTSGNFVLSKSTISIFSNLSVQFYLLDVAMIYVMQRSELPYCFVPGKFYQYNGLVSMHDDIFWSVKSFLKVVKTVMQIALIRRAKIFEC